MKYNIGDIVNFEYNDCIFLDGEIKGFYVGKTYDDVIGYYILLNENMYLIKREEVHPKPKPLIFTTKKPYTWFGNEEWIEKEIDKELVWHDGFILQKSVKDILKQIKDPFFQYYHYKLSDDKLPDNVFFNDKKKATTLMFGKEATVVKCGKDDEYSRRIGFLEAYFQATCGLSKTKAKKYLENIVKDKEENK
jgi:hypothetical protein